MAHLIDKNKNDTRSADGACSSFIREILAKNPLVAACRPETGKIGADSRASIILIMKCSLSWLVKPCFQELCEKKPVFLHTDFIRGLTGDREGIQFIRDFIRPAGVVSTRSTTIRAARADGLPVIQRIFLIDSDSLKTSMESIRENRPDAVEIMPGIAPSVIQEVVGNLEIPVIAAGLIRSQEDIENAFLAGAHAVSLSSSQFWNNDVSGIRNK